MLLKWKVISGGDDSQGDVERQRDSGFPDNSRFVNLRDSEADGGLAGYGLVDLRSK